MFESNAAPRQRHRMDGRPLSASLTGLAVISR
jgi:hypothetical protein